MDWAMSLTKQEKLAVLKFWIWEQKNRWKIIGSLLKKTCAKSAGAETAMVKLLC